MTSAEYLQQFKKARALMQEQNYLSALTILDYLHQEVPERYAPLFGKALCHTELEQVYDGELAFQKCL